MLITFSVANWRLFRDEVTFSMVATAEKQKKETLADLSLGSKLLPIAAIYGANASGKTSLIKALAFVKEFVVNGSLPDSAINIDTFALDEKFLKKPSSFKVQICILDQYYEFSFTADRQKIREERLVQILKTTEKELYHRKGKTFEFNNPLAKDKRLKFISEGTRDNQLFLTNSVSQNVELQHPVFKSIYNWFKESLVILMTESRFHAFQRFIQETDPLSAKVSKLLPLLNTGIVGLEGRDVDIDTLGLPAPFLQKLKSMGEGVSAGIGNLVDDMLVIKNEKGVLKAKRLMAKHRKVDGSEVFFNMRDESDGSKRCIHLLPMFIDLVSEGPAKVYVIDEIDRSLHSELFIQLLEFYLGHCEAHKRSQLIFTTHNLLTMDQDLLRRDEMWVTERDQEGAASLISFGEYKEVRNDKDIRKSYQQGRLGGVPKIQLDSAVV
jgi:AAA15 family ATPase/GTPase